MLLNFQGKKEGLEISNNYEIMFEDILKRQSDFSEINLPRDNIYCQAKTHHPIFTSSMLTKNSVLYLDTSKVSDAIRRSRTLSGGRRGATTEAQPFQSRKAQSA